LQRIKTPIIPVHQHFANCVAPHELDKEAICVFAATGFFLDTDTYYKNKKVLRPASENTIDENGFLVESIPWFNWHYTPRKITFEEALEEFTELFEKIIKEQLQDKKAILALSGGLDSRTQAVALAKLKTPVNSYSYSFKGGFSESGISKKIAKTAGFSFKEFTIPQSYLWQDIEKLASINHCYSEFTHPRQMAVLEELRKMDGLFSLGHWGDVLFDRGAPANATNEDLGALIIKKVVKKGGMELATALWKEWGLGGDFKTYFNGRIAQLLKKIPITNPSAKMRAFKSLYWAPRWTSINLSIFEEAHPITLPYYDDRMCKFICTVPEEFLADRKLQIAYIKAQNPDIAKITWEDHKPFNLYNFEKNKTPNNLPYRITNKLGRTIKGAMGKPYIQRNWELQFVGSENDGKLQEYLFSENLHPFLSKPLVAKFYNHFKTVDDVKYSHPVSMLLTLAVWYKNRTNE